jgi:transposase
VRKVLEAQGRSLMVNHGLAPVQNWWKPRNFAVVALPAWIKELLQNSQPILVALQEKIQALTVQLENAVMTEQPRGLGKMTSVVIDREIGDWNRFNNRRQIASYTGLCPGEYSSGNTRLQSCVTKHGNPRLRAALVELAWRLVRFQPNYRAVRKWKERLAKGTLTTGAARKKAIVAVARQLAVDLWRVRTGRLTQEQLGLEILK